MARSLNVTGSPRGATSFSRRPPSPSHPKGSRSGALAGGRRYGEGSSAPQDLPPSSVAATVGSSGTARREQPSGSGSATGGGHGSGSGSSSSAQRTGTGGPGLTEQNVIQTSEFYEGMRRDRDKAGESEQKQSRDAALRAEMAEIGKKLPKGGK